MSEEQKVQTNAAESPKTDAPAGLQSETKSLVERTDDVVKRAEAVEQKMAGHVANFEALVARQQLSGRADAGSGVKQPNPNEAVQENVKKIISHYYK